LEKRDPVSEYPFLAMENGHLFLPPVPEPSCGGHGGEILRSVEGDSSDLHYGVLPTKNGKPLNRL